MFKLSIIGIGIVVLVAAIGIFAFQGGQLGESQGGKIKIASTIYPLYDIAQNVGGDKVEASVIVPPGATPHLYEFTPRQLQELQGTRAVFAIGYGLDDWVQRATEAIPGSQVRTVENDIQLRQTAEEEQGSIDPHYWLHFGNARQIIDNMAGALSELDPENAETYQENARRYKEQFAAKEQELKARLAALENRNIVTLHDAWFYFAEDLDLNVVGTFEPASGEEPTPQLLAALRQTIVANNIKVVFAEPQLSSTSLRNFARDNNLTIAMLDPGEGAETPFLELMEYNVNEILKALAE